jgi:hypothetical protein
MTSVQIEFLQPYTNSLGTTKPRGYRTIMAYDQAVELIRTGVAAIYYDSDLRSEARRQVQDIDLAHDLRAILHADQLAAKRPSWHHRLRHFISSLFRGDLK